MELENDELAHFDPLVRKVVQTWVEAGKVEVEAENMERFIAELKHEAGEAESPYKMLKALAKQVEVSEQVEEYYASREQLMDLVKPFVDAW